jgi:hypothetical protein
VAELAGYQSTKNPSRAKILQRSPSSIAPEPSNGGDAAGVGPPEYLPHKAGKRRKRMLFYTTNCQLEYHENIFSPDEVEAARVEMVKAQKALDDYEVLYGHAPEKRGVFLGLGLRSEAN